MTTKKEEPALKNGHMTQIRRDLCYAAGTRAYGPNPLDAALRKLKTMKVEELPEERIDQIQQTMQYATGDNIGLENAFQLLDALGEDPDSHPEVVVLLDAAFAEADERAMQAAERELEHQKQMERQRREEQDRQERADLEREVAKRNRKRKVR